MRIPHVDDRVRLLGPVPNTALDRGQVGVVCSEWTRGSGDQPMFEVEFLATIGNDMVEVQRRLVPLAQIEIEESAVAI